MIFNPIIYFIKILCVLNRKTRDPWTVLGSRGDSKFDLGIY